MTSAQEMPRSWGSASELRAEGWRGVAVREETGLWVGTSPETAGPEAPGSAKHSCAGWTEPVGEMSLWARTLRTALFLQAITCRAGWGG